MQDKQPKGQGWGQRSATGARVAAAPSRAIATTLSCLWTSAQASGPELISALAQALARPGNVATEAVLGAQSTWLGRKGEQRVSEKLPELIVDTQA